MPEIHIYTLLTSIFAFCSALSRASLIDFSASLGSMILPFLIPLDWQYPEPITLIALFSLVISSILAIKQTILSEPISIAVITPFDWLDLNF